VIDQRHVYLDRLADTGIGEMVFNTFAIGLVGQLLAELGEIVRLLPVTLLDFQQDGTAPA
jgi:hypothetical protein